MSDSIYEFVMANLEACRSEWQQVSDGSGVPKSTIVKIGCRIVKSPGVHSIEKLANYFRAHPAIDPPRKKRASSTAASAA
jgi:hypothetical protein